MFVELVAESFPLVATLAVLLLLGMLFWARTRRSAGATDAGPVEPEKALVPGLSATAQDLRAIEQGITHTPNETIQMLQALCREQGIDDRAHAAHAQPIDVLVSRLEQHLEISPATPS